MKTFAKRISVLVLLAIAGCASPVRVDYDANADFSNFRQYGWYDGDIRGLDTLSSSVLAKKRVVRAVDTVLREKGFTAKEVLDCDFVVFVHGTVQQRVKVHEIAGHHDPYGGFGMGVSHLDERPRREGVLFIDMFDIATQELIWRGSLSQPVKYYRDPSKAQAAMDKTIRKILEKFPPNLSR